LFLKRCKNTLFLVWPCFFNNNFFNRLNYYNTMRYKLKTPGEPEIVQERELVNDVICGPIYVENVLIVIHIGERNAQFQRVAFA